MTQERPAAGLIFFLGPALLVAAAVVMRTTRTVESYRAVMERVAVFRPVAEAAARSEGVELPLLLAVACAESGGRPAVRSAAGAVGLMQLVPGTAAEMAAAAGEPAPDLRDPGTSLRLGARYLRRQLDRFGGSASAKERALAAYNAGPDKVRAWVEGGAPDEPAAFLASIPYGETRHFVRRVEEFEARWRVEIAPARGR